MPQPATRPETDNYQSLLVAEPKQRVQPRRRRSSCAWLVGIVFLLLLILVPLGLFLWKYYHGDVTRLRQSPVNIMTSQASFDPTLGDGKFVFNYQPESLSKISNTGHGWKIYLKDDSNDTVTAVHLHGTYRLVQLHAHWDPVGHDNGSEHSINGIGFAGEIHLVHYNLKYKSVDEALFYSDGLAVLGIFLKEDDDIQENENLNDLVDTLHHIVWKNQTKYIDKLVDLKKFLPENTKQFWTYEGSLTTAPFTECVIWTVFKNSIPISSSQLNEFRKLKTIMEHEQFHVVDHHNAHGDDDDISGLVRYPQPLNGRVVKSSFKWNEAKRR